MAAEARSEQQKQSPEAPEKSRENPAVARAATEIPPSDQFKALLDRMTTPTAVVGRDIPSLTLTNNGGDLKVAGLSGGPRFDNPAGGAAPGRERGDMPAKPAVTKPEVPIVNFATVDGKKVDRAIDAFHAASSGEKIDDKGVTTALKGKSEAEIRAMNVGYKAKYGMTLDEQLREDYARGDGAADKYRKAHELIDHKDHVDVTKERKYVEQLAAGAMNGSDFDAFRKNMKDFEARKGTGPDQVSPEEIGRTYREVSRLLEAKGNTPTDQFQRRNLASQVMDQAADPTRVSQGKFGTCVPASLESAIYTKSPSDAARMVSDVALTGKYVGRSGEVVTQNPQPLSDQALIWPRSGDNRSHASEIFQITASNLFHQEQKDGKRYEQIAVAPPANKTDNGERLWSTNDAPGTEAKDSAGKPLRFPGMRTEDMTKLAQSITGKPFIDSIQSSSYGGTSLDAQTTVIRDEKQLEDRLAEAKRDGRFPMVVLVNTNSEPFYTDSGRGAAGGSGGAHSITIRDYTPGVNGQPGSVNIDNQWSKGNDYLSAKQMGVHDFYRAMQSDSVAASELTKDLAKPRAEGRVDLAKEVDLLRTDRSWQAPATYGAAASELVKRVGADLDKRGNVSQAERENLGAQLAKLSPTMGIEQRLAFNEQLRDANLVPQTMNSQEDAYARSYAYLGVRAGMDVVEKQHSLKTDGTMAERMQADLDRRMFQAWLDRQDAPVKTFIAKTVDGYDASLTKMELGI